MRPKVQEVAAAAREGVQELRPGDRVSVMVFNTAARGCCCRSRTISKRCSAPSSKMC